MLCFVVSTMCRYGLSSFLKTPHPRPLHPRPSGIKFPISDAFPTPSPEDTKRYSREGCRLNDGFARKDELVRRFSETVEARSSGSKV